MRPRGLLVGTRARRSPEGRVGSWSALAFRTTGGIYALSSLEGSISTSTLMVLHVLASIGQTLASNIDIGAKSRRGKGPRTTSGAGRYVPRIIGPCFVLLSARPRISQLTGSYPQAGAIAPSTKLLYTI